MRLRSRQSFMQAAGNLQIEGLGICISYWTNYKWKEEFCENTSKLRVFLSITDMKPFGMSFPRTIWFKPNHLRIGFG